MIPLLLLLLICTILGCSAPRREMPIGTIQGRAHLSPLMGRQVRSGGIITAVGEDWIYLQGAPDGDPATSDGILVQTAAPGLKQGDEIRVAGIVSEVVPGGTHMANLSTTLIDSATAEVTGRDRPLPRPVVLGREGRVPPSQVISSDELPVNLRVKDQVQRNRFDPEHDAVDFFESLEGMLVTVRRSVAVSATQTFSEDQSEVVILPDAGLGTSSGRRTRNGGILLQPSDQHYGGQNPERIQIQLDRALYPGAVPSIRVGDMVSEVTGIVRYSFGNYEIAATRPFEVTRVGRPPERTTLRSSSNALTVSSYNVLNLSPTPGDSAQRRLLAGQIVQSLHSPDILALQEIQDDSGEQDDGTTSADRTLRALTEAILAAGGSRYDAFNVPPANGRLGGVPGGNIRNAFLYNSGRVRLLKYRALTPAILAQAGARDTLAFRDARDPLEGMFQFRGEAVRVVNNHLTSRFGSSPVFGSVHPFVEAGQAERTAQVLALHAYAAHLLEAESGSRLIVLGDMNTFEFSAELEQMLPGSPQILYPVLFRVPENERYSFNFEGNSQTLDHVFVSRALRGMAEIDIVHLNVDYPAVPGSTASDHDPVLLRVRWPVSDR